MLLVPRAIADHDLLFGDLPAKHRRQRDAVVERIRLVSEERDLARRVVLSKLLGRGRSGKPVSDERCAITCERSETAHQAGVRRRENSSCRWTRDWCSCSRRSPARATDTRWRGWNSRCTTRGAGPAAIGRFAEPTERRSGRSGPGSNCQLDDALACSLQSGASAHRRRLHGRPKGSTAGSPAPLRELDQYARAIRWVLTVTQSPRYDL